MPLDNPHNRYKLNLKYVDVILFITIVSNTNLYAVILTRFFRTLH